MLVGILAGVITFIVGRVGWDIHQAHSRRVQILHVLCLDASRTLKQIDRTLPILFRMLDKLEQEAWKPTRASLPAYLMLDPTVLDPQDCVEPLKAEETDPILRYFARWKTINEMLSVYRAQYAELGTDLDDARREEVGREIEATLNQLANRLAYLRRHCLEIMVAWCNDTYPAAMKWPRVERDTGGLFRDPNELEGELVRWREGLAKLGSGSPKALLPAPTTTPAL